MLNGKCGRTLLIAWQEFALQRRRPTLFIYLAAAATSSWILTEAVWQFGSGWATSEFGVAQAFTSRGFFSLHAIFTASLVASSLLRDVDSRSEELVYSTRLTTTEWLAGKLLGLTVIIGLVIGGHALLHAAAQQLWLADSRLGPFSFVASVKPAFLFLGPGLALVTALTTLLAVRFRQFLVPVSTSAILVAIVFILREFDPADLAPSWNRFLGWIDPSGGRWLTNTWLADHRGEEFYNQNSIGLDPGFIVSRVLLCCALPAAGLIAARWLHRGLRSGGRAKRVEELTAVEPPRSIRDLEQPHRVPSHFAAALGVFRVELRQLIFHPAFLLFALFMLLWAGILGASLQGPFGTPLRLSAGSFAAGSYYKFLFLALPLLIFAVADSFTRDQRTRTWEMICSAPIRPSSLLIGRLGASFGLLGVLFGLTWFAGFVIVLLQGGSFWNPSPFLLLWGSC